MSSRGLSDWGQLQVVRAPRSGRVRSRELDGPFPQHLALRLCKEKSVTPYSWCLPDCASIGKTGTSGTLAGTVTTSGNRDKHWL